MNILIIGTSIPDKISFLNFTKKHVDAIKKVLPSAKITISNDDKVIEKVLPDTDAIIYSPSQHPLKTEYYKLPNLKWVQLTSAGANLVAKELAKTPILLTNASGVHPIPISEHVLAFMLMFSRGIHDSYRAQIEEKSWMRDLAGENVFELAGEIAGIVGYGKIGSRVAHLANAVGMTVVALEHDKKIKDKFIDKSYKNVSELLKVSRFVIDCLPLAPATEGYFDLKKFKQMRSDSYFINIGRGGTVVEKDLIKALKDETIKGAALDVFEVEPLPENSPLWKMRKVIITPHISGRTPKYTDRVIEIFCENLKAYLSKKPMPTLVDKTRGY